MRAAALIPIGTIVLLSVAMFLLNTGDTDSDFIPGDEKTELQWNCHHAEQALYALDWDKAMHHIERALEIDENSAEAMALMASLQRMRGHTEKSSATAARAAELMEKMPDNEERRLVLLRLSSFGPLTSVERLDSLLVLLRETSPDNVFVLSVAAARTEQNGDHEGAAKLWRRILELDPNFASAYNSLGYLEANQGQYEQAANLLRKYVYLAPKVANAHDSLGDILSFTGRYEEAAAEFSKALDLQPDLYFSRLGLGRIYLALGRVEKGMGILIKTRELLEGTDNVQAVDRLLIQIYFLYELHEDLDIALEDYLRRWPNDFFVSGQYLALQAAIREQPAKACAIHDSTLAVWRTLPQYRDNDNFRRQVNGIAMRFQAELATLNKDYETAADFWKQELDNGMDRPPHQQFYPRYGYALALAETGQCEGALDHTRFNLRVNPRQHRTMILQARCCLETGRFDKMQETLDLLRESIADSDSDYFARQEYTRLHEQLMAASP